MVGGMDGLIPGGKEKADDNLEVEIEERKPPPGRRTEQPDDEREEDARLAYDVSEDDEVEERGLSRRQRRNRQRKTVVAGRDQEIVGLYQRVDALTHMINQMGQSQVGITVNNIDTQLGAAQQALGLADAEIKKAVAAGDLARYEELRGLKDEAQTRVYQLYRTKQGIAQEMQARGGQVMRPPQQQQQPPATNLDQRTQDFTSTFMDRFDFDPNGVDERTLIIKAIDDSVAAEGYRSNTPLYWRTLEKKLAARDILPVEDDDDETPAARPVRRVNGGGRPPTASGTGNRRGSGRTFRLDPMARDYLDGEGLLHTEGLNDQQKARRSRLLTSWQEGQRKLARGEI
jgi:hypothetical protein